MRLTNARCTRQSWKDTSYLQHSMHTHETYKFLAIAQVAKLFETHAIELARQLT